MGKKLGEELCWHVGGPLDCNSTPVDIDGVRFLAIPVALRNGHELKVNNRGQIHYNTISLKASEADGDMKIHVCTSEHVRGAERNTNDSRRYAVENARVPTKTALATLLQNTQAVIRQLDLDYPCEWHDVEKHGGNKDDLPVLRPKSVKGRVVYMLVQRTF